LRDLSNDFHFGVSRSFLEDMGQNELAEVEWAAYRKDNHITSRGSSGAACANSYEQVQWSFLDKHFPSVFRSMQFYKRLNAFRTVLKTRKMLDSFKSAMGSRVDFLNSSVDNTTVLSAFHQMTVVVCGRASSTEAQDKSFVNTIDKADLDAVLMIVFEFAVFLVSERLEARVAISSRNAEAPPLES
jgi:hypothetical protein